MLHSRESPEESNYTESLEKQQLTDLKKKIWSIDSPTLHYVWREC